MTSNRNRMKTRILTLERDNPKKELEFELHFRQLLSVEERFKRMWTRSLQIARAMKAHGHKKAPLIIERS